MTQKRNHSFYVYLLILISYLCAYGTELYLDWIFPHCLRHCSGEVSLDFDTLYVGSHASKVVGEMSGREKITVTSPLSFDDGVHIEILPIPNSHAKGSLALIADDYVFLGDATYPMVGHGEPDVYNVQILEQQIKLLKSLNASRFCLSHKRGLVRDKSSVIQFLESVLARRQKNENYIVA